MICQWRDPQCPCNTGGACQYEAYPSRGGVTHIATEHVRPIVEAHDKLVRVAKAAQSFLTSGCPDKHGNPLPPWCTRPLGDLADTVGDLPSELLTDPATPAEQEVVPHPEPTDISRGEHSTAPPTTLSEQGAERHDIGWAVERLRQGKRVKRKLWVDNASICLEDDRWIGCRSNLSPARNYWNIAAHVSDLLATDWELAEIERIDRAEKRG